MMPVKTPLRLAPPLANAVPSRIASPPTRAGWGADIAAILPQPTNDPPAAHPAPGARVIAPAESAPEPRDKIYALRFRTKLCRNFEEKGSCPYESRCMFAHGEGQLRTTERNIADGILSTQAILDFKAQNQSVENEKGASRRSANTVRLVGRQPVRVGETNEPVVAPSTPPLQYYNPAVNPIVLDTPNSPDHSFSSERQSSDGESQEVVLPSPNWSPAGPPLRRKDEVESLLLSDDASNHSIVTLPGASVASSSGWSASSTDVGGARKSFRWNPYRWTPIVPPTEEPENS